MATLFNIAKSPFARERKTVSTAVVTPTAATYRDTASAPTTRPARGALVSVLTSPIFYSILAGAAPTNDATVAGVGTPAAAGSQILLETYEQVANFQAIRNGGADAVLEFTYYR